MNNLVMALAWCWVQTLVVAALAIWLSVVATRRSPAAGAAIAWTGILPTLALTLLVPVPVPRWAVGALSRPQRRMALAASSDATTDLITSRPSPEAAAETNAGFSMNLVLLRKIAGSVQRSQGAAAKHREVNGVALSLFALGTFLGLARLAYGVWSIAMLCRGSRPIDDQRMQTIVNTLRLKLGLRQSPRLRESSGLVSAAVMGWWRSTVLLPPTWGEWSPEELNAVLAHELAHVYRRDFAQRLLAVFTSALQCAQPLVYWLRWQLTLAQEIAADELAAEAVGSRAEYLQALARLALRQDRPIDGSMGALLPVFSGFLLRRIAMLRAKDGRAGRGLRLPLQWSAIGIVIFAAIATTAIRGLAEPPEHEADGSVRVATATAVKTKPPATGADAHAAAAVLFQRPAFDLSAVAGKNGGFRVRLGEILKRTGFVENSRKLHESFAVLFEDLFPNTKSPVWSLEDIDYIAGDLFFKVRPAPEPTKGHPNELGFGALSFVIRWNKPLNGQFESMLRIPGATEKSHEGTVYVELPIIRAMGPTKLCVCRIDDHSLFAAQNEKLFLSRLNTLHAPAEPKDWQKAWISVDGGLLALVSTDANIERPLGDPGDEINEEAELFHDLFDHTRGYAVGVDWQENADGVSVVKGQFRFDRAEDANRFKNAIHTWTDKAADLVNAEDAKGEKEKTAKGEPAEKQIKAMLEALQQAKIETRQDDKGWLVEVQLAGPLDYRPLWGP